MESEETKNYMVYMHINLINKKMYCGQTCVGLERRANTTGSGYKGCTKFWNAIQKYGWDNFDHVIIKDHLTADEADALETRLIRKYNLTEDGYNIYEGGEHAAKPIKDLTGQVFGRWKVLRRDLEHDGTYWICECQCEKHTIKSIDGYILKSGGTTSCGCLRFGRVTYYKHGMYKSPLFDLWSCMKKRALHQGNGFCKSWEESSNFFEWSKQSGYEEGLYLILKDWRLPYSPDNCRWGTLEDLQKHYISSQTVFYEYQGEKYTAQEFSEMSGIPHNIIRNRISKLGWSVEDAMTKDIFQTHPITNEYTIKDDYVIITSKKNNYTTEIKIDLEDFEYVKDYIWLHDQGHVISKNGPGNKWTRLDAYLLNVPQENIRRFKLDFKNGDKMDLRKSNMIIRNSDKSGYYMYYLQNIFNSTFIYHFPKGWMVGKYNERQTSHKDFIEALKVHDERYQTTLYDDYINSDYIPYVPEDGS